MCVGMWRVPCARVKHSGCSRIVLGQVRQRESIVGAELGELWVKLVDKGGNIWLNSHEHQFGGVVFLHRCIKICAANIKGDNCALFGSGKLGNDEDRADAYSRRGCIGTCVMVAILAISASD